MTATGRGLSVRVDGPEVTIARAGPRCQAMEAGSGGADPRCLFRKAKSVEAVCHFAGGWDFRKRPRVVCGDQALRGGPSG